MLCACSLKPWDISLASNSLNTSKDVYALDTSQEDQEIILHEWPAAAGSDKNMDKSASLRVERSVSLNPITFFLRFRSARILTVEPVIFLYMFGSNLYFPLYQQYFFNQFAKNVIGNSSELPNSTYYCLTSNLTDEYGGKGTYVEVETLSSHLNIYVSLCNQIPSIIFTLLYGPLSDRFGRRLVIVIVSLSAITQGMLSLGIVHWNLSVYLCICLC